MMTRRMRRLTRRSRALAFAWTVLRSYREGRRRGQSPLRAWRFGRAVARWHQRNGPAHS